MPKRDDQRRTFLTAENLVSDFDGLVAKRKKWRSSFSLGEKNLIGLHPELYQALKYLKKVYLSNSAPISLKVMYIYKFYLKRN